jgi:hypothetical protein
MRANAPKVAALAVLLSVTHAESSIIESRFSKLKQRRIRRGEPR